MSTGSKGTKFPVFVLCAFALAVGSLHATDTASHKTDTASSHKKAAKKPQLPPLPSGPTGRPVPQLPLDSIKPLAPQVTFQNGQLTIDAPNSTLGDILRAVKKQTNADIDIPEATDRVVTHLGPGPVRAVIAELLNGSRFDYVLVGSPEDPNVLARVVLVPKSGPDNPATAGQQQAKTQGGHTPADASAQDSSDADMSDDSSSADETPIEQPAAEPDQSNQSDQPGVKTPQQLLQEMQQRQMQFQQQLQQQQQQQGGGQPGQNPVPPPGMPPGRVPPQQPPDQ